MQVKLLPTGTTATSNEQESMTVSGITERAQGLQGKEI